MKTLRARQLCEHIGGLRKDLIPRLGETPGGATVVIVVSARSGKVVVILDDRAAGMFYQRHRLGPVPKESDYADR